MEFLLRSDLSMRKKILSIIFFTLVAFYFLLPGCNAPTAVYVGESNFIKHSFENQLNTSGLTVDARNFLVTNCLYNKFNDNPVEVINICAEQVNLKKSDIIIEHNVRRTLKVIIELCIYIGNKNERPENEIIKYWMSACYFSYRYLFDQELTPAIADLKTPDTGSVILYYNYSLYQLFNYMEKNKLIYKDTYSIPMLSGVINFNKAYSNLPWSIDTFKRFFNCFDYQSVNLNEKIFSKGIGVPLGGIPADNDRFPDIGELVKIIKYLYPCTFLIEFDNLNENSKEITATPKFFDFFKSAYIDINSRKILLSNSYSAIIAKFLNVYPLEAETGYFFNPGRMIYNNLMGIYFTAPFDKNKIPVVMIHGLISNPQSLYQMFNTLMQYSEIRDNYQFWFYFYPTGQPIMLTTYILRGILDEINKNYNMLDKNSKYNDMVLVGYSLGGLIAQLAVQKSNGDSIEKIIFNNKELDDLKIDKLHKERIEKLLSFKPLEFVKDVIFISTPHRGAQMADWVGMQMLADFASSPQDYYLDYKDTFIFLSKFARKYNDHIITGNALNNLSPASDFIKVTQNLPYSKDVKIYSIIGDEKKAGRLGGTDGVTPYSSAHLNNVEREVVINSDHHSIYLPACAKEVLRILLENIQKNKDLNNDNE